MEIRKIKNRTTMFTYNLGSWDLNLHLIQGEKFNYIIDTGLGSLSVAPIKDYLKKDLKSIIIINSHYHWDHIWGNGEFKDNFIISHRLCREMIMNKWDFMRKRNGSYINGEAEYSLPNIVFEKEIYFAEDKIRLIHTPGHTIDSVSVIDEEEGVINIGDNAGDSLEKIIPSIEADKSMYLDSLHRYLELDIDTIISSHNTVLGKENIEKIIKLLS